MAEELEIKVKAETGEAVANLGKTEKAVENLTNEVKELGTEGNKAFKEITDGAQDAEAAAKKTAEELRKAAYAEGNAERLRRGNIRKNVNEARDEDPLATAAPKLTETLAKYTQLTGVITKLAGIFGLAIAGAKAFNAVVNMISDSLDKTAKAENEAHERKIKFDKALRLVNAGTIALGHSTEEMFKNYDEYNAKLDRTKKGLLTNEEAAAKYAKAIEYLNRTVKDAQGSMTFKIISPEEVNGTLDSVKALASGLNDVFAKAFKAGGDEEVVKWAAANEEEVNKVIAIFKAYGATVPEELKRAKEALDADRSVKKWVQQNAKEYEQLIEIQRDANNEAGRVATEMGKWTDATQGPHSAFGALSGDFTAINAEVGRFIEAGGKASEVMVGMTSIILTVAQATERQNEAFRENIRLMGALREEQMATLDAAQGWTDYLITLKDGYDSGVTSLATYINMLAEFRSQLLRLFGNATGEAKKGLQDMFDLITKMIATAGPRGPVDFSYKGQLDKAFKGRQ